MFWLGGHHDSRVIDNHYNSVELPRLLSRGYETLTRRTLVLPVWAKALFLRDANPPPLRMGKNVKPGIFKGFVCIYA